MDDTEYFRDSRVSGFGCRVSGVGCRVSGLVGVMILHLL
ncbi:hypothetical protein D1AOALGA4SA_12235 [Olavius algarvensis Delta 1 endosymbiont]|nr:hypothetical protein D1AOALGA4SA_12235 [Olavius algarvensis Delta 1 endosymbiont]